MRIQTFISIVFITVVLCSSAYAVGIGGPTLVKEVFVPNQEYHLGYVLFADQHVDNSYTVYAKKDLAQYVVFEKTRLENISRGSKVPISGKIIFPSELEPGWHSLYVCVREDCKGAGTVCGRAGVCANLAFMVLYPGIYPVISLSAPNTNEKEPVDFTVNVKNYGKNKINQATGRIEVFDLSNNHVGTAFLDTQSVESYKDAKLTARFQTNGLLPGNFTAKAFVDCDSEKKTANASFRIGTLDIKIVDHTEELEVSGIKRFITTVESVWNDPLNIYADIVIQDSEKKVEAKTATYRLEPWKTLDMEAFIDTAGLEEKKYNVRITVYFAGEQKVLDSNIRMTAPEKPKTQQTSAVEAEKPAPGISSTAITIILIAIVIILTVINIFLAAHNKKKR
jgi:hypothetical protein